MTVQELLATIEIYKDLYPEMPYYRVIITPGPVMEDDCVVSVDSTVGQLIIEVS